MKTRSIRCLITLAAIGLPAGVAAHPVSRADAIFVHSVNGPAIAPFMYLGAKHMVTGYDHILFLVGVIFFLYNLRDVVKYVSYFAIGHSLTLIAGVWWHVQVSPYLIDAIIGLSVVYKGFENIGGFERLGWKFNTRAAVLVFGLFHGFGLATRLQDLGVQKNGLLVNLLSFNVGVEIGQVLALSIVLIALGYWRTRTSFTDYAFAANTALMTGGFMLVGFHLTGFAVSRW